MDPDVNYSLTTVYSAIEVNLAIWAASIPALWPLIRGRMHTNRSSRRGYTGDQGPGNQGRNSNWTPKNDEDPEQRFHQGLSDDEMEDLARDSDEIILTRVAKRSNHSSTEISPGVLREGTHTSHEDSRKHLAS